MSKFLFAWEMGGGFGHVGEMLPIARVLRSRGHEVVFAVCNLGVAEVTLAREGFPILPAPPWSPAPRPRGNPSINFAELLFHAGYSDTATLTGNIRAWREIYRVTNPDLVIVDYAPTALLAAQTTGLVTITIGIGFYMPPALHPMPSQQPWASVPQSRLIQAEQLTMNRINAALEALDTAPLESFAELLVCHKAFFCTFAELDHYGVRPGVSYSGPVYTEIFGLKPDWPRGKGKRIFAFLHSKSQQIDHLFQQLRALGTPTFAYVRGASDRHLKEIACSTIHVTAEPIDLSYVIKSCDAVICNGGHSTIASTLMAGRPLVMVPQVIEQALMAFRLEQSGLAMVFGPRLHPDRYRLLIEKLLSGSSHAEKAAAFADTHHGHNITSQVEEIARNCEQIVAIRN